MLRQVGLLIICVLATTCHCASVLDFFTTTQTAQATYYGYTGGGHCTLDPTPLAGTNGVWSTVAIQTTDYMAGATCGMCIIMTGSGVGSGADPVVGTYKVFVNDECPTCTGAADLDLGLTGDGRWNIEWKAVPCNITTPVQFLFQGSNLYYLKLQVRNHNIPVAKLEVQKGSTWIVGTRVPDNFFEFNPSKQTFPMTVRVTAIDGQNFTETIAALSNDVVIEGTKQFGSLFGTTSAGTSSSSSSSSTSSSSTFSSTTSVATSSSTSSGSISSSTSSSAVITGSPDNTKSDQQSSSSTNVGAIAGGIVGAIVLLAIAIALAVFLVKRRQNSHYTNNYPTSQPSTQSAPVATVTMSSAQQNNPSSVFQVGDVIQAKYSRDGQFYRAKIEGIQSSNYLVNYVDYNEKEWLPASSLKK